MAMKDWKKSGKDRWSNESRAVGLAIEKGETKEQYNYGVILRSGFVVAGGEKYLKGFNTKSQANSFARQYMRNH